ncbi:hypothetical protein [Candidatus Galacturonibacter soehngenii]|nr:hypothetical protein [Candidatus Galacturonibacter soehngenii]
MYRNANIKIKEKDEKSKPTSPSIEENYDLTAQRIRPIITAIK